MIKGPDLSNPFPGLRYFSGSDSKLFFGRDEQIGAGHHLVQRPRGAEVHANGAGVHAEANRQRLEQV